jgi:glutamyl-tRNA reductase
LALSVIQRKPGSDLTAGGVVWRTCLREISFSVPQGGFAGDGRVFHDEGAYAHLLEVICGLDSPILGETEVMHQFKAFAALIPDERRDLKELGRRLMVDARLVRSRHLRGLGSRSYGSAVRRRVRHFGRVAIVGTGILGNEILPFVADQDRIVDVWGRREHVNLETPRTTYRQIGDAHPVMPGPAAMVIAAPVPSSGIAKLATFYSDLRLLIDLRAEAAGDPPPGVAPLATLADVFGELRDAAASNERSLELAREEIRQCALAYVSREKVRPSGWHDLCA